MEHYTWGCRLRVNLRVDFRLLCCKLSTTTLFYRRLETTESRQQTYYCQKINISHGEQLSDPNTPTMRISHCGRGTRPRGGLLLHLYTPPLKSLRRYHVSNPALCNQNQTRKLSKSSEQTCLRADPLLWVTTGKDYQAWDAGICFTVEKWPVWCTNTVWCVRECQCVCITECVLCSPILRI